uniref:Uncharacterized protein n=1 Tax=Parascaris univalens TaxID=6257 RepID=A0A915BM06_PARUN
MVVGTGLVIACAIGGYLYFCDKRECAERLRAWAEKLSDQTSHEATNEEPTQHSHRPLRRSSREISGKGSYRKKRSRSRRSRRSKRKSRRKHKKIHLDREIVENIIAILQRAEEGAKSNKSSTSRNAGKAEMAVSTPPIDAPAFPSGGVPMFIQHNAQPGVIIRSPAPVVYTTVQIPRGNSIRRQSSSRSDAQSGGKNGENNTSRRSKRKKDKRKRQRSRRELLKESDKGSSERASQSANKEDNGEGKKKKERHKSKTVNRRSTNKSRKSRRSSREGIKSGPGGEAGTSKDRTSDVAEKASK